MNPYIAYVHFIVLQTLMHIRFLLAVPPISPYTLRPHTLVTFTPLFQKTTRTKCIDWYKNHERIQLHESI